MASFRRALQELIRDPALIRSCMRECTKCTVIPSRSFSQVAQQQLPSMSPAVRYLVGTHNIQDISIIHASGPKSRLLKGDILKHLANLNEPVSEKPASKPAKRSPSLKSPSSVTRAEYTDVSVADDRRQAAAEMVKAKREIPHVYVNVECQVPSWLADHGKDIAKAHMLKCIAQTAQDDPGVCVVWNGRGPQSVPRPSVAVAGGTGSTLLALDSISMMTLRDLSAAMATGSTPHHDASICVTFSQDRTSQTGILSPGQTLAVHVTTHSSEGKVDGLVTVCATGDGRVLELDKLVQWLSALRENCSRTV